MDKNEMNVLLTLKNCLEEITFNGQRNTAIIFQMFGLINDRIDFLNNANKEKDTTESEE